MSSAFVMTTRLIWKRAWLGALCTVLLLVTGPVTLPAVFVVLPDSIAGDLAQLFHSQLFILGLSWVTFGFLCIHAAYQSPLQLTRGLPVSSTRIASWVMWSTVVMVVVPSLLINGLVRLLFMDASWPDRDYSVLGPTLFITAFIMVAWSAYWSLQAKGFWRLLFWASAVGALVAWLIFRYYPEGKLVPWKVVTLTEWITVLVICGIGWLAGIRAYARIRCGVAVTSRPWSRLENWLNGDRWQQSEQSIPVVGSRVQAFTRLHWRDGCSAVTLLVVIFGGLTLILNLYGYLYKAIYGYVNPLIGSNRPLATFGVFLGSSFAMFFLLGQSLLQRDFSSMKGYLAQLPVTDQELSHALVVNLFKSFGLLLFWVVIFGFGVSYLTIVCYQGLDGFYQDCVWILKEKFFLVPLFSLLIVWMLISNGLSLIWTGHTKFMGYVFGAVMVLFYPTLILSIGPLRNQRPDLSLVWTLLVIGVVCIMTILAFQYAHRLGLISLRSIWLATIFYLVISIVFWNFWNTSLLIDRVLFSSFMIFTVLPFATIPLAVSWNRHR